MSDKDFEERTVIVPLWKAYKTGNYIRTKKAVSVLKEEISKIIDNDNFVIDNKVNEQIWAKGIKKPPRRVTVKIKRQEDGKIVVTLP